MSRERTSSSGLRREGRELALKLLYREEVTGLTDEAIPGFEELRPEAVEFARALVAGVRGHIEEIDVTISSASEHWEISRMGAVDRTVLRIGAFELLYLRDVPIGVVINEAVEIGRKYSSHECGRFVNGVLDNVARQSRGQTAGGGDQGCD